MKCLAASYWAISLNQRMVPLRWHAQLIDARQIDLDGLQDHGGGLLRMSRGGVGETR
jgi:hypothetical protein